MILVPDLGLRPSVEDNGIETRSEHDPEAESTSTVDIGYMVRGGTSKKLTI